MVKSNNRMVKLINYKVEKCGDNDKKTVMKIK